MNEPSWHSSFLVGGLGTFGGVSCQRDQGPILLVDQGLQTNSAPLGGEGLLPGLG